MRVSEMVQRITALATKAGNLSLMPGTHVVEEENQVPQAVHSSPRVHHGVCPRYTHTHK